MAILTPEQLAEGKALIQVAKHVNQAYALQLVETIESAQERINQSVQLLAKAIALNEQPQSWDYSGFVSEAFKILKGDS